MNLLLRSYQFMFKLYICLLLLLFKPIAIMAETQRQTIMAIGIPLADHYAGIVAYEKYRDRMQYADYQFKILPGPALVRAYFRSQPDVDIAFNVSPMVMDMFANKANFRWISLIHRDGNALVINHLMNTKVKLNSDRKMRRPDEKVANAIRFFKQKTGKPLEIAIPSPLATHTTILYKYLKENGLSFGYRIAEDTDVLLRVVKPPKSPVYLKTKAARAEAVAFEQSLPWAEIVETSRYGHVAWYSKDVMQHESGHVECIIIAKDEVIKHKRPALQEVINYIHQAGRDIEIARKQGGEALETIVVMIRKHIPSHTREAIIQSLRADLNVINYLNLNVDVNAKSSFKEIMDLAFEAGFIQTKIDIDALADSSFSTDITISENTLVKHIKKQDSYQDN